MPSLNPLNWFKQKPDPELMDFGRNVAYAESSKTAAEVEREKDLGVNLELIRDRFLDENNEKMCYTKIPLQDENGNYLQDSEGNMQFAKQVNYSQLALRELRSQLTRVGFITEKEAAIKKNNVEAVVTMIQMSEPEGPYYLNKSAYYLAAEANLKGAVDDSVKGRKAKLLKVTRKATSVEVNQQTNKQQEEYI